VSGLCKQSQTPCSRDREARVIVELASMVRHRSHSYDRERDHDYRNPSIREPERERDYIKDEKHSSTRNPPNEYRKRRRSRSRDVHSRRQRERSISRDKDEERKDKKCVLVFHSRRCPANLKQTQARQVRGAQGPQSREITH
jgi:hypothetical protein